MSSSSKVLSIKPKINKKAAIPVRGPFGQRYNPDDSIYQDYPRIGSTDPGSPPNVYPPTPITIPKSFEKQTVNQNEEDKAQ